LSYGRVDSAGEAMLIRSSYSLSRKLCRKPLSVSSDVIAVGPNGNRTVFAGRIKRGNPLLKLGGPVTDASLVGNTLMLASFGIGTLDLVSQQFVMVAPASRSVQFSLGELDQSGNLLVSALKGRNFRGTYTMYGAESGYSDVKTIEGNARDVSYDVCGDYLMRSKYDAKSGDTTSVDVLSNPFRSVLAPGPSPLAATTTLSLWNSACDNTNAVYAVSKPSGNDTLIYLAPLAG